MPDGAIARTMAEDPDPPHAYVLYTIGKRADLIRCLDEGRKDIRDLRDELDKSRSTVYKATRELETVRVVESTGDGYGLTLFGRLLFRKFDRLVTETQTIWDIEDVLAGLPPDLPVDPSLFADAEVIVTEPHAPDRAVEELESFVAELGRFRTLTPVHRTRYLSFGRERAEKGEFAGEFVLEHRLLEYVLSNHADVFGELLRNDSLTWYETDRELPFGLVIPESSSVPIGVTLYDESRQLRAFVRTDDPTAAKWAEETYRSFRDDATRLSPPVDSLTDA